MQICFVCCEYPPGPHGGIGSFTQEMARSLSAAGHDVRVIGVYNRDYPAEDYQVDQGVRIWRLRESTGRFGWIVARFQLYKAIASWARQGLIDLVEIPDWQGWAAHWPSLPVPVVARLNGSSSYFASELGTKVNSVAFWLERSSIRRADRWCSVSQYTAEKTREVFRLSSKPSAILHNAVAGSPKFIDNRSAYDVIYSGTLVEKKGVVSLFRAWPTVLQQTDGTARLHIYGKDGRSAAGESMQEFLQGMLDKRDQSTIKFHGHVDRAVLLDALSRARLAVFPSYAEAFAFAPLEAMSTGCPTIYSRRGPGPELIDDGQNGLLVEPGNVGEIASAITRLIHRDSLARKLGDAGYETIRRNFSDRDSLSKNIAFYENCVRQYKQAANVRSAAPSPETQVVQT